MAVVITSITRISPAPCQHFRIVVNINGRTVTRDVTPSSISDTGLDEAVLRILKYYVVEKNLGLAGVVGKTILPDVL
jgi:hypothetical protein